MKKKKKYRVTGLVTISVSTVVQATSPEEACEVAFDHPMMTLCHQCAHGEDDREWVTSGELDSDVTELRAESEE